jgi:hypothetical protein
MVVVGRAVYTTEFTGVIYVLHNAPSHPVSVAGFSGILGRRPDRRRPRVGRGADWCIVV